MKKQTRIKILKILIIGLISALTFNFASPHFLDDVTTAYAVGDLTINWGVPTGNPIFVVPNMLPGDVEQRQVIVTNNATSARPVAVRGVPSSDPDNLSAVIDFVILDGVTPVYGNASPTGPKTLADFFADSDPINGLALSTLGPSSTTTYTFRATFEPDAGDGFQNTSVVFDLIIGIGFEVPDECQNISFSGSPIFGTSGNDNIKGTNANDLIIAFEGNDKVNGSNGDDCIIGNEGNDKLDGGSNGQDVVFGDEGDDVVDGSNGDDLLFGGSGSDKMYGTNGDDKIFAGEGNDKIEASNGNDYVIAGPGNDIIDAGNGNDYVEGNEGNDQMRGRNNNDTLLGGPDSDSANGNLGIDTCDAEAETGCEI